MEFKLLFNYEVYEFFKLFFVTSKSKSTFKYTFKSVLYTFCMQNNTIHKIRCIKYILLIIQYVDIF